MLLAARPLADVRDVNSWRPVLSLEGRSGTPFPVYFQLYDAHQLTQQHGYEPPGLRYVAASGATLQATFKSIDDSKNFTRFLTQPFPGDLSVWSTSALATDPLRGTVDVLLTLTEPSGITYAVVQAALLVDDGTGLC